IVLITCICLLRGYYPPGLPTRSKKAWEHTSEVYPFSSFTLSCGSCESSTVYRHTGVERNGSGAERSDFRKRGFKVGVGSRHAICYGFTFQFKMTVIGDVASSMIVFIRNRWPSGETSYCWWLG